jgi:hypothetical protein
MLIISLTGCGIASADGLVRNLEPLTGSSLESSLRKDTIMAKLEDGRIVETPTEARSAERGPSILVLLTVSVVLAVVMMGAVWTVFFKT